MLRERSQAQPRSVDLRSKALILACIIVAYGSNFWPSPELRGAGYRLLNISAYEGWGIFLPHLLLYTTLMAAVSAGLWFVLVRAGILPPPPLERFREAIPLGIIGGLLALAVSVLAAFFILPPGSVRWIAPDPWKIAGNLFSNFYEEFVFRGFLLIGLRAVVGFWPAAILSSAAWAFLHSQYPLALQFEILGVGIGFCWLIRKTQSLWAPYIAHEVLDVLGDSLIG